MTFEEWLDVPMKLELKPEGKEMMVYLNNPEEVAILKLAAVYTNIFSRMIEEGKITSAQCIDILSEIAIQVCGGCGDTNKTEIYTDFNRYFGKN